MPREGRAGVAGLCSEEGEGGEPRLTEPLLHKDVEEREKRRRGCLHEPAVMGGWGYCLLVSQN